jgi:hypothetical protein
MGHHTKKNDDKATGEKEIQMAGAHLTRISPM